jgi:uncharacterized protein (TIGR03435 family)
MIRVLQRLATTLEYAQDRAPELDPAGPSQSADTSTPSIFTALQEQLGLKLEARRHPVEILVIDHAEKPSEN